MNKNPFLLFVTFSLISGPWSALAVHVSSEDTKLNFLSLAQKYGYKAEEYDVQTKDGYILKLFHIPGDSSRTVLLLHGVLDIGDTFILRGRTSLAASLVTRGYDVWIGNNRGNKYTRRHLRLKPEDDAFWNFSFHEMAIYDLPAFIDFILRHNKVPRLSLIGHSLGNMQFYVLGAMQPEYNEKVNVAIALGPAAYVNADNHPEPVSTIIKLMVLLNDWYALSNQAEIFGNTSLVIKFRNSVCQSKVGYEICGDLIAALVGEDLEEVEREFFHTIMDYYPSSSARRLSVHLVQMALSRRFEQYDYGSGKNLEVYGSISPPIYDLCKVTMKVALLVGANDRITTEQNAAILRDNLPNVVSYHVMRRKKFNHIDFIWGRHMYKYLFPHVLKVLEEHGLSSS